MYHRWICGNNTGDVSEDLLYLVSRLGVTALKLHAILMKIWPLCEVVLFLICYYVLGHKVFV